VGNIGVVQKEKTEGKIDKDSQEELKVHSDQKGEEEDQVKKDVPLEKMTKADLLEKIKEVQKTAEENYDLYIRSQADNDNMKKRFQREKEDLAKYSNESLIKQLLSVADNLEKAISHSNDEKSIGALREGVELTLKGLMDTLERVGLQAVKAAGEPFDPNFHEAVAGMEDGTVKPGTVLQELQKGYMLNQRLIRPAKVIVSKSSD
jgi:molecular chaperone GrpE